MNRADIPNIITILRIFLVVPIVMLLLQKEFLYALLLYTVAGISDGLDGYIAKRYNYVSRLGSVLDPLADKLLLVSTFITLAWLELLPAWLVVAVISRDLLIVIGGAAYHLLIGQYEMEPSLISKVNTFSQIVLGLAIVFSESLLSLPQWLTDWLILLVLGTTIISGVDYVWTWGRRAYQVRRNGNGE